MSSSIRHWEQASQLSEEDKDKSESEEHFNVSLVIGALDLAASCISLLKQYLMFLKKYTGMEINLKNK